VTAYPKRLIEVDLPIKKISAHARREKSIRHGHISTLHIWWARRPLASCRAVLCAALWPDPADPLCPQKFRDDACKLINAFATKAASNKTLAQSCSHTTWKKCQALSKVDGGLDSGRDAHWNVLRFALLDFIADFSDWDNSAIREYLETARALTQSAHEALGGMPGTRPLVVDPFAGGGSIPIEALRVGADAFASDLNPVAVLLNKVVLEYIPQYGQTLADEVRKWGAWVRCEAAKELSDAFPNDVDGATPIAYLWARTIRCEGPGCGVELPLIRNLQLTRKSRTWFLRLRPAPKAIDIELCEGVTSELGTVRSGSATCPCCTYTTPAKSVKAQLSSKRGGAESPRLLAIYVERDGLRCFRLPSQTDHDAAEIASRKLDRSRLPTDEINPIRPYKNSRGLSAVTRIGITRFGDLYTPRQALALLTLQEISFRIADAEGDRTFNRVVATLIHFVVSRYIFQNCALSRWNATGAKIEGAFGKQALQVVWDFVEANPFSNGSANWNNALDWVVEVVEANLVLDGSGTVQRAAAQDQLVPDGAANIIATDPPYFAAIPYTDLSNVFYVWERELLKRLYPDMYTSGLINQCREIIVTNANLDCDGEAKSPEFFGREMSAALNSARRSLAPDGIAVVVFADSSTSSWETILGAIVSAGWTVTSSWPIDTEMQNRTQAQDSASLQSSVHIVCRPRQEATSTLNRTEVGDWRDVLQELPRRIHEWMPRLQSEGIVGADAIFACLGPALEIFSRHSRVEKPNGDEVTLKEYLEYVWAAVSKEAVSMIFAGADTTGFEEDARLTAMWLWTLSSGPSAGEGVVPDEMDELDEDSEEKPAQSTKVKGFSLEYDAARKIAQGLGAHLELLTNLVEVRGDTARLLPVAERTKALFGKEGNESPAAKRKKSAQLSLPGLLEEMEQEGTGWTLQNAAKPGNTNLDRLHQALILFAAGRGEGLRHFLVDEGVGKDQRFWSLAQSLCALYPSGTDERRWSEGLLARKKGLGL
jgi:putative DNA methylase